MSIEKWCGIGKVNVFLPENHSKVADEVEVDEHAEFTGPCPGCLRKWGKLNGHRLVLGVLSDHEGVLE